MKLIPKAGMALVKPYTKYSDREGLIWIPQMGRYVSGRSGQVENYTPYNENGNSFIWTNGKRRSVPAWHQNSTYEGMIGKHIMFTTGVKLVFEGRDYIMVRLEHIILISDDKIGSDNQDISLAPRCQWCKSSGEHNMLLDSSGYCPKCNLNPKGMVRPDAKDVTVSDDEVYALGGRKLKDDRRKALGLAKKERIISYKGQSNRTKLKAARS